MAKVIANTIAVTKVVLARLRFLAVFIIAALVVGYWDDIKNHMDKWTRPAVPPDSLAHASDIEYYCAMHLNVVRSEPGNCPICGMPLVKRKKGMQAELPPDVEGRVQLSPQRVAMANVGWSTVGYQTLSRSIHAVGVLDYAEPRFAQLAARVPGRVDRLFLQYVGQPVKKGQVVYSLYSPEVYTAIRDYLTARKQVNDQIGKLKSETAMDSGDLYNAAMQRLILWGITREQLDTMDTAFDKSGEIPTHLEVTSPIDGIVVSKDVIEGAYVEAGSTTFTIADLTGLWLKVKVFEQDMPLVHVGEQTLISVESVPGEMFVGTVTYVDFKLDPQTRTVDVRVDVDNPKLALRPGMFADARFEIPVTAESLGGMAMTTPTTRTAGNSSAAYGAALQQYLIAQKQLAVDSEDQVIASLQGAMLALAPLSDEPAMKPLVQRFDDGVRAMAGTRITGMREAFKEVSQAMIDLGKLAKLPTDGVSVSIYRCPMAKADWLQPAGETRNPYYGSEMPGCGNAVEPLPRAQVVVVASTQPQPTKLLAVPRTAVIDAGKRQIVYVRSGEGVFDMKQVELGPAAGEWYPVLKGLKEGDQVVTRGAFLIDAENRLNPSQRTGMANDESGTNGQ